MLLIVSVSVTSASGIPDFSRPRRLAITPESGCLETYRASSVFNHGCGLRLPLHSADADLDPVDGINRDVLTDNV